MSLPSPILRRGALVFALAALLAVAGAASAAAPANDVCSGAVVIPPGGPFPYAAAVVDTTQASNDAGDPEFPCNTKFPPPTPNGAVSKSVWYAFTPSSSDNYQIDTIGSTPGGLYDTILGVFAGACGSMVPVTGACNDDTAASLQSAVQVRLTAGTTYYILVAGLGSLDFLTHNITPSAGGQLHLNVSKVAISYPYSYVIPSVAHSQGVTLYVSDLNVTNVDTQDGLYTLQFLSHGNLGDTTPATGGTTTSSPNTIRAGGSALFADVLTSLGVSPSTNPYGMVLIRSTVRLLTGARTYTQGGGGTFGQYTLGVDTASSEILNGNEAGTFIGVHEDANSRTNLAVFNTAGVACNVKFELKRANGEEAAPFTIRAMPANTMVQANGLRRLFGISDDIVSSSVVLTNLTNGCHLGGAAYVIDGNTTPGTNDPATIPLQK